MANKKIKIICVCAARPNFMKIAPLIHSFRASGHIENLLVHTGQHYDEKMSKSFFDDLNIPRPDTNLEVGSASPVVQIAQIMIRFEPIVQEFQPDYVLVVGDVNSTLACAVVAVKLHVKLIHVEAGLRSFDKTMPEETNRILTDHISDLLFVSESAGIENLKTEGIDPKKVHFVGNVMIDTLMANLEKAQKSDILRQLNLKVRDYAVITLHRPSNVDNPTAFAQLIEAFEEIQKDLKLVFPIHPRTRARIAAANLDKRLEAMPNMIVTEPLGYLDFLRLNSEAAFVMTDSGGIQEETTVLGVACLTLRENTERPVTVELGTNQLVPLRPEAIVRSVRQIRQNRNNQKHQIPPLWDGQAAQRITQIILNGNLHPQQTRD